MTHSLPIDPLKNDLIASLSESNVVVSAPTGSGKSTQIPRWCQKRGRVLVVEPRRVACRSLAARVEELEGVSLGSTVGYVVRDDQKATDETTLVYATPGVVLRWLQSGKADAFDTLILDEFHERTLDVDLLLALLLKKNMRLIVMSATLDAKRLTEHMNATLLVGEGRAFPVTNSHLPCEGILPETRELERRVSRAVDQALNHPGDILVFLPGKGEIASVSSHLRSRQDVKVLPLHGGLSLSEQMRVFNPDSKRKVILSTNVAETSLTVPGVGVVIDSGLVRQTRYHRDRGFLTLVPIAADSAEQRAGRAGRTAPGVCLRLWSPQARLDSLTRPEIQRESLVPLLLSAAACGENIHTLPFLDPPAEHAISTALDELKALGAVNEEGEINDRGKALFSLPLDAHHGRLLMEAKARDCLDPMVDLVSVLSVGRPLFLRTPLPDPDDDLRKRGCDVTAMIQAIRQGNTKKHGLDSFTLEEARKTRDRLRQWFEIAPNAPSQNLHAETLARVALAADPRCAHVARTRKKSIAWSNGGTEIALGRESAVDESKHAAIAVFDSRAVAVKQRDTLVIATCAMPLNLRWMAGEGLGRDRLAQTRIEGDRIVAVIERVYAKRILMEREEPPRGVLAREAIAHAYLQNQIFKGNQKETKRRLREKRIYAELIRTGQWEGEPMEALPPMEEWIVQRLQDLGVESGEDLALLKADDFIPDELPSHIREKVSSLFPSDISLGDMHFSVEVNVPKRLVTLHKTSGKRKELPSLQFLPAFKGFKIHVEDRGKVRILRG